VATIEAGSMIVVGPEDLFAQAADLTHDSGLVAIGSVGRAACFGDSREFSARSEDWVFRSTGDLRDIDLFGPTKTSLADPKGPFRVDQCLKRSIGIRNEGGLWVVRDEDLGMSLELDDELFVPESKSIFGFDITVPNIRTLYYMHLTAGACRKNDKIAKRLLEDFMIEHPHASLPAEKFTEFDAFITERNKRLIHKIKSIYHKTVPSGAKKALIPLIQKARAARSTAE